MTDEQTMPDASTDPQGRLEALVIWLELLGIDCSREGNTDDAFMLFALIGIMAAFGLFAVSPWWSGFTAAAIIFNGKHYLSARRMQAKAR